MGCLVLAKQAQLEQNNSTLKIHSNIRLHRKITILTLQTKRILGVVDIPHHMKRINVSTKAVPSDSNKQGFEAIDAYTTLEGGVIG